MNCDQLLQNYAPPGTNGVRQVKGGAASLAPNLQSNGPSTEAHNLGSDIDFVCLSHLRWNFVFQRPQHILSRRAKQGRVFYFEEPLLAEHGGPRLQVTHTPEGVVVVVPELPDGLTRLESDAAQRELLNQFLHDYGIRRYVLWLYTPMALGFTRHLQPEAVVYDCMDELSAFKGASPILREREAELFAWADIVFTGGQSLYEAKRDKHPCVYPFPSSIDVAHFARGRSRGEEPPDQAAIPYPRLGFFGVLDERLDLELLRSIAAARPEWHLVMIGPVVKIDPAELPRLPNVHYLGGKTYSELPAYISGWQVALLLFALNESTRYISPTKTPEYLASGKPVVATPIRDVVRPYGEQQLVRIGATQHEFVAAIEQALAEGASAEWLARVDEFLSTSSWDTTCERMFALVFEATAEKNTQLALPQEIVAVTFTQQGTEPIAASASDD